MGLGQLLNIIDPGQQRVATVLSGTDPPHLQDHMCVLKVILVPTAVQGLATRPAGQQADHQRCRHGIGH
jgi:hypothetical protein